MILGALLSIVLTLVATVNNPSVVVWTIDEALPGNLVDGEVEKKEETVKA